MNNIKEKSYLISIIVPIFNAEKYIERCIRSIINQTYNNMEIILINDGSTDKSLNICKRIMKCDKRIKIIDKLNEGVSATRNLGISIATGDYIAFVDADDIVNERFIEKSVEKLQNDEFDIVIGGIENNIKEKFIIKQEKILKREDKTELIKALISSEENKYLPYEGNGGLAYSTGRLYKKKLIQKIEYPTKIKYREDLIFNLKAFIEAESIILIDDIWYKYYLNKDSACFKYIENYSYESKIFLNELVNTIKNSKYDIKDEIIKCILRTYAAWIRISVVNDSNKDGYISKIRKIKDSFYDEYWLKAFNKTKLKNIEMKYKIIVIAYRLRLDFIIYCISVFNKQKNKFKYRKL